MRVGLRCQPTAEDLARELTSLLALLGRDLRKLRLLLVRQRDLHSLSVGAGKWGVNLFRTLAPYPCAPWHFLYFLPDPHGQGSFRPTFSPVTRGPLPFVLGAPAARACSSSRFFFC